MILFDNLIKELKDNYIHKYPHTHLQPQDYQCADQNEIIFSSDTAFTLGGNNLPSIGGTLITSNDLFCDNKIILIGDDLNQIKEDNPFARISLIKVKEDFDLTNSNKLYQSIRLIDYVRYHVYPKGYMIRISPFSKIESVKVSKSALKDGLSFSHVGKLYIDEYLKIPHIKSATILFITKKDFPFNEVEKIIKKEKDITLTLDHLLNKVKMDCASCSLQQICNEVEKLITKKDK